VDLLALFGLLALLASAGLTAGGAFASGPGAQAAEATDAFAELRPAGNAPQNGGTVSPGTKFTLDLWIDAGTNNDVSSQQSYLTFQNSVLQVVSPSGSGCTPTDRVTEDSVTFDIDLQNEVCNGPGNCEFRGNTVGPGTIAYASGALNNDPAGGEFRIASITFCAVPGGRATLHWQFVPPDPINRDTQILNAGGTLVHNQALYRDYVINVGGPTATPDRRAPTPTPTNGVSATSTPCAMSFSDVAEGDPFTEYINDMYCRGVISGYDDRMFRPYDTTRRSQIAKMVILAFDFPINTGGGPHFTDVPQGSEMYNYIETAFNLGLVTGFDNRLFKPWDYVKRGQIAKIVVLAAAKVNPEDWALQNPSTPSFRDVPRTDTFYRYVETARAHNMITGFNDGTFQLYDYAKRGQICKIIAGALTED
jgi:hypothetical protein